MEALEGRDVPAYLHWSGAQGTAFDNPENWLMDGVVSIRAPQYQDTLVFDEFAINPDCYGAHGFGLPDSIYDYDTIQFYPGYSGTVTFVPEADATPYDPEASVGDRNRGVAVRRLFMDSGTVVQQGDATELTVLVHLGWYGGNLNNGPYLSRVTVSGAIYAATATIAPNGGTVNLGSHFELRDGAVATMWEGTVAFSNGADVTIAGGATLDADPGVNKIAMFAAAPAGVLVKVELDSLLNFKTGTMAVDGRVWNQGGVVTVYQEATGEITGANAGVNPAYRQTLGHTRIQRGATLKTNASYVRISGGYLQTVDAGIDTTAATIHTAYVEVTGGSVYINSGPGVTSTGTNYGTLRVVGTVFWEGGIFFPRVPAEQDGGDADLWYATRDFDISGTAELVPSPLSFEGDVMAPTSGHRWSVLKAGGAITAANNTPVYNGNLWAIDRIGNPVTEWKVRAK